MVLNDMASNFLTPAWGDRALDVGALSTLRSGGISAGAYDDSEGGGGFNLGAHVGDRLAYVQRNRALLRSLLPGDPVWLSQVHGTMVVDAAGIKPGIEADASIATQPGIVCVVQTADCLPVLFCDAESKVVGAAHAGWRGLANGVLENTVQRMRDAGAAEILAWLGPAIGPEQFEVGDDVVAAFAVRGPEMGTAFRGIEGHPGKYLADIYMLARMVLAKAGVRDIHGGGLCTVSDRHRFYSYRRDRITGRMASMIWLESPAQ